MYILKMHLVSSTKRGRTECGKDMKPGNSCNDEGTATCQKCLEARAVIEERPGGVFLERFREYMEDRLFLSLK